MLPRWPPPLEIPLARGSSTHFPADSRLALPSSWRVSPAKARSALERSARWRLGQAEAMNVSSRASPDGRSPRCAHCAIVLETLLAMGSSTHLPANSRVLSRLPGASRSRPHAFHFGVPHSLRSRRWAPAARTHNGLGSSSHAAAGPFRSDAPVVDGSRRIFASDPGDRTGPKIGLAMDCSEVLSRPIKSALSSSREQKSED